jgi:tetratricopeptide (TPR) repeat protein
VALQVAALDVLAAAELQAGQPHFARQVLAQALALAHAHPDQRLRARVEARLAQVALTEGEPRQALALASNAHGSCDDADARLRCVAVAGRALAALGRPDEAVLALEQALTQARGLAASGWVAEVAYELGNVHTARHHAEAARDAFAVAIAAAAAAGQEGLGLRSQRGLAWSLRRLGALETADQTLAEASRTAAERQHVGEWVAAEVLRAQWALDAGELQAAVDRLAKLPLQADTGVPLAVLGDALTLRGRLWAQGGRWTEASEDLERAVAVLRTAGEPRSLGAALLLAGQVAGLRGDGAACGRQLADALAITAQHGLPEQEVVRRVIARLAQQAEAAD